MPSFRIERSTKRAAKIQVASAENTESTLTMSDALRAFLRAWAEDNPHVKAILQDRDQLEERAMLAEQKFQANRKH